MSGPRSRPSLPRLLFLDQKVGACAPGVKHFRHLLVGDVTVDFQIWLQADSPDHRLEVYTPRSRRMRAQFSRELHWSSVRDVPLWGTDAAESAGAEPLGALDRRILRNCGFEFSFDALRGEDSFKQARKASIEIILAEFIHD